MDWHLFGLWVLLVMWCCLLVAAGGWLEQRRGRNGKRPMHPLRAAYVWTSFGVLFMVLLGPLHQELGGRHGAAYLGVTFMLALVAAGFAAELVAKRRARRVQDHPVPGQEP